jgi:hypothetical protein
MPSRRAAQTRPGGRKARESGRRAEVLGAARRLYARKGYQKTAMVEIAGSPSWRSGRSTSCFRQESDPPEPARGPSDELVGRVRAAVDGTPTSATSCGRS